MAACRANKYDVLLNCLVNILVFKINKNRFIVTKIVHKTWGGGGGKGVG